MGISVIGGGMPRGLSAVSFTTPAEAAPFSFSFFFLSSARRGEAARMAGDIPRSDSKFRLFMIHLIRPRVLCPHLRIQWNPTHIHLSIDTLTPKLKFPACGYALVWPPATTMLKLSGLGKCGITASSGSLYHVAYGSRPCSACGYSNRYA